MLAFCGLNCVKCDAFIATQTNDDEMRARVAREWSTALDTTIKPEDINCTGCLSSGVKTYYCDQMCEIRKCASARKFETCADCEAYACDKLDQVFKISQDAKIALDNLK